MGGFGGHLGCTPPAKTASTTALAWNGPVPKVLSPTHSTWVGIPSGWMGSSDVPHATSGEPNPTQVLVHL